ncbi:signal recognition particle subunit srp68 [Coniosporium tulheliwenetii]|uniref:Signal recognition particle subunit srp68 n=1 Tax=Coniosporium tulheliwenetii TaxID=3383036 RepID=A0ACC2YN54_9PEZI|nr:signal recognition particle subunit srp68 [Cladosporium sp. JES 115]
MHMKSSHSEDNAKGGNTGSTRSHIISRLNKAAKYAKELANLLADQSTTGATDTDVLEAQAYAYSIAGAEEFERQSEGNPQKRNWDACLRDFAAARVIYNALLRSTEKDLFKEILASTIDPSIRYAAYQSKLPRTTAVSTVAKQYFPKDSSDLVAAVEKLDADALNDEAAASASQKPGAEKVPNTITWRSRTANIVDASIGQALFSVSTAEARLSDFLASVGPDTPSKDKAAAYDAVMIASQDVTDATRRAIEELEREGVPEGDPRMQDLRVTSLAVNYALISWRIGRNRVLIGADDGLSLAGEKRKPPKRPQKEEGTGRKLARLRERVVLYDATLQSLDSIKELRGAVRDSAFIAELDAKRAYFQALKCLNIGYSHALLSAPKNALALFVRAQGLAATASSATSETPASPSGPPNLDIAPSSVQALERHLQALISQHRGLVTLHNLSPNSTTATTSAPLVERLNEYPANGVDLANLVTYPPKLKPVPVKPLFFDVAWNYVEYPGRAKKEVVENGVEEKEERVEKVEVEEKPVRRVVWVWTVVLRDCGREAGCWAWSCEE